MILDRPITLLKSHTHNGVVHAIGAELRVLAHDAEWLVERGIAVITGHTQPAPPPAITPAPAADEPVTAEPEPEPAPTDPEPMNPGDDHE